MKILYFIAVATFIAIGGTMAAQGSDNEQNKRSIEAVVMNYFKHFDDRNIIEFCKVWVHNDEAILILPAKRYDGWKEIEERFQNRIAELVAAKNPARHTITNMATYAYEDWGWSVLDYEFGDSKGRETQIVRKIGGEWKLIHVHISPRQ